MDPQNQTANPVPNPQIPQTQNVHVNNLPTQPVEQANPQTSPDVQEKQNTPKENLGNKKARSPLTWILSVVFVFTAIFSLLFAYYYFTLPENSKEESQSESQTPTPTSPQTQAPTPTPTSTPTVGAARRTYVSDMYGFSLEYPSDFILNEEPTDPTQGDGATAIVDINKLTDDKNSMMFRVMLVEEIITSGITSESLSDFEYLDWKGVRATSTSKIADQTYLDAIAVTKKSPSGQLFQISWVHFYENTNANKTEEVLLKIIDSFRFTDKNEKGVVTGSISVYKFDINGVGVRLKAESTASEVTRMKIWTNASSEESVQWRPFATSYEMPWNGGFQTVYVKFEDKAKNVSAVYSDVIDSPSGPSGI